MQLPPKGSMPFFLIVYSSPSLYTDRCKTSGIHALFMFSSPCFHSTFQQDVFKINSGFIISKIKGVSSVSFTLECPLLLIFCCLQLTLPLNCVDCMLPVTLFYRFGKWVCYFECFFLIFPMTSFWEFTVLLYFVCLFSSVWLFIQFYGSN